MRDVRPCPILHCGCAASDQAQLVCRRELVRLLAHVCAETPAAWGPVGQQAQQGLLLHCLDLGEMWVLLASIPGCSAPAIRHKLKAQA